MSSSTLILQCTCESDFQDETYGNGWRLHNTNGAHLIGMRTATCTVCGEKKYKTETTRTKDQITQELEWSNDSN